MLMKLIVTISIVNAVAIAAVANSNDWKIKKTEWTEADEKAFSEFIAKIGQAVEKRECNSLQSCLKHKNNPYLSSDTTPIRVHADCAKLSYVMRGYFAWKNGLPFSVANGIKAAPGSTGSNLRYNSRGNIVTSRLNFIPTKSSSGVNFVKAIPTLTSTVPNAVYSATFRFNYDNNDSDNLFTDYYPVDINREAIRPGTIIYDPNGHVAIVYKVTSDGKVYFIDAHPDNSLTSGMYGTKFVRSHPAQGAGFKNFRPIRLVGATYDSNAGSYIGGKIVPAKNKDLKHFDIVQFFGTDRTPRTDWSKGPFIIGGVKYEYYEYVRNMLSTGKLILNPVNEIKSLAEDICQTTLDRVDAVNAALKVGIQNKPHPAKLPENIYGTSGEWEEYSTPSRDARLKTSFVELRESAADLIQRHSVGDPKVDYKGTDIRRDMRNAYLAVSNACQITYAKSNGQIMKLTLDQVRERLFDLSFDPYHCSELRWGAKSSEELATCKDNANKRAWYNAERRLRNQIERKYDLRMDLTLEQLAAGKPGIGVETPPNVNILDVLK